jgi:hypothetical protein
MYSMNGEHIAKYGFNIIDIKVIVESVCGKNVITRVISFFMSCEKVVVDRDSR